MIKITRNNNIISFDNNNFVLAEKDFGQANINNATEQSYGQQGTIITYSSLKERRISLTGWILANNNTEMRKLKQTLSFITNPLYSFDLIINDKYKLICKLSNTISFAKNPTENNDTQCRFMINAICGNPYFIATTDIITKTNTVIGNLIFPLKYEIGKKDYMGLFDDSNVFRVNNVSDTSIGCIIEILATDSILNPKITNKVTGEYLLLNTNIPANCKITINTNFKQKSIIFMNSWGATISAMQAFTDGSTFLQLDVGNNYFEYSHDSVSDNMVVSISYTPTYLNI